MQPIVRVADVTKTFGAAPILKGVSFEVSAGELVCIIGPTGCGKSILLRCLNGLETADAGRIQMCGVTMVHGANAPSQPRDIAHQLRRHVGMVAQGSSLFPHKTLLQNVMMAPMVVKNTPRDEAVATAERLLEKVGLSEQMDRYPVDLSDGQRQRGAIARALAMAPKVLLYDEPTSVLDPGMAGDVLEVVKKLGAEGMTQIVVTHDVQFARETSRRIIYMEDGEIVETLERNAQSNDGFVEGTRDPRTQQFLSRFS